MGKKAHFVEVNSIRFQKYKNFLKARAKKYGVTEELMQDWVLHNKHTEKYLSDEKYIFFKKEWDDYILKNELSYNTANNWTRLEEYKIVRKYNFPDGFEEKVVNSFTKEGKSLTELCEMYSITYAEVLAIIYTRNHHQIKEIFIANRNSKILDDLNRGFTLKEVCERNNCTYSKAYYVHTAYRKKTKKAPDYLDKVIHLYNQGQTLKNIAIRLKKRKSELYCHVRIFCVADKQGKLSKRKLPR